MALQTLLRSSPPKVHEEQVESWSEPPRVHVSVGTVTERSAAEVRAEAEWVGDAARTAPLPAAPATPALSPGLARLLNAALMDSTFAEQLVASPVAAARHAIESSAEVFGTTLPSPALQLSLPALTESEWVILRRMPRAESLAAFAQALRRLAARSDSAPRATIHELRTPLSAPVSAPASPEGALAGAA